MRVPTSLQATVGGEIMPRRARRIPTFREWIRGLRGIPRLLGILVEFVGIFLEGLAAFIMAMVENPIGVWIWAEARWAHHRECGRVFLRQWCREFAASLTGGWLGEFDPAEADTLPEQ